VGPDKESVVAEMLEVEQTIVDRTKAVAEGSDDAGSLVEALLSVDRESITAKAAVRYLLQVKRWDLTPESAMAPAMEYLFASYEGKPKPEPEVYRAQTRDLIRTLWGFECVEVPLTPEVVREPAPEKKPAAKKKAPAKKPAPRKSKPSISEPDSQDIRTDIDTTGASSRLKKVIAIQRGS
jgi:hypothetical protein